MKAYIIKRLILIIPTIFFVTLIVFMTVRFIPGDAVDIMSTMLLRTSEVEDPTEAIREELGLDLPIYVQYGRWMGGVFKGDLGDSLWTSIPVTENLIRRIPVSLELGILGIIIAVIIGLPIGIYSAIRQETWGDYVSRTFAILCIAVPHFWLGTIVMVYPAIWWKWSPPLMYIPFWEDPLANLGMFIIPSIIVGMWLSGNIMRFTRTMMLEVLRQDYIRTAWAKGLRERVVIIRHALKNALIPIVTWIALLIPVTLGGEIVVESIFGLPGLGLAMVEAIGMRDYPIISAINLFIAALVLGVNVVVDLTYAWIDPRIKYK